MTHRGPGNKVRNFKAVGRLRLNKLNLDPLAAAWKGFMSRDKRKSVNKIEEAMERSLDTLSEYDQFSAEIAPALRGAVKAGKSPEEIYNMVLAHASARMVSIALTDKSPTIAMAALKDILDRSKGKATENKTVKLELANASDEQLDAKLKSLLGDEESDSTSETLQ